MNQSDDGARLAELLVRAEQAADRKEAIRCIRAAGRLRQEIKENNHGRSIKA